MRVERVAPNGGNLGVDNALSVRVSRGGWHETGVFMIDEILSCVPWLMVN